MARGGWQERDREGLGSRPPSSLPVLVWTTAPDCLLRKRHHAQCWVKTVHPTTALDCGQARQPPPFPRPQRARSPSLEGTQRQVFSSRRSRGGALRTVRVAGTHPPAGGGGAQAGGACRHGSAQRTWKESPAFKRQTRKPRLRADCPDESSLTSGFSPIEFAALRVSAKWGAGDRWGRAAGGWKTGCSSCGRQTDSLLPTTERTGQGPPTGQRRTPVTPSKARPTLQISAARHGGPWALRARPGEEGGFRVGDNPSLQGHSRCRE